ncbi:MAG: hypothetical protein WCI71_15080 [Bacteroidota bacterium]
MKDDKKTTREINDFTLMYDGMYWLKEKDGFYPVRLYPDDLILLFQTEGVVNEVDGDFDFWGQRYFQFTKATLILEDSLPSFQYFDECGSTLRLVPCQVKRII